MGDAINNGVARRGILICGSGVGVCVAANKIPGIRAGMCHDTYSAHQGVEHDDMNVIVFGARIIGPALAYELADAFIQANSLQRRALHAPLQQSESHRVEVHVRPAKVRHVYFNSMAFALLEAGALGFSNEFKPG